MNNLIDINSVLKQLDGRFTIEFKHNGKTYTQKNCAICTVGKILFIDGAFIEVAFEVTNISMDPQVKSIENNA